MRRFILILTGIMLVLSIEVKAQAKYGDIGWGNYEMTINVVQEKDSFFLNVNYKDRKLKLVDSPKLLIKLMDDEVIYLDGQFISSSDKTEGGVMISGIFIQSSHIVNQALFPISVNQIEQFTKGIKKIRLNTSPRYHEKEWKKDKIGKMLYENYVKIKTDSFADGF